MIWCACSTIVLAENCLQGSDSVTVNGLFARHRLASSSRARAYLNGTCLAQRDKEAATVFREESRNSELAGRL